MSIGPVLLRAGLLSGFGLVALALGGCGAAPEPSDESAGAEPAEIGSVEQAYGELTCVNYTDYDCGTLGTGDTCAAPSFNANYDHTQCTHTWVAHATTTVQHGALGIYSGVTPDGNTFPCDSAWVRMTVWRRAPGTQLYKVAVKDKTVQGYRNSSGRCSLPTVTAPSFEPGQIKIGAQAGFLIYYAPVQITIL